MKIRQIIYKNHLTPPFIKPFHNIHHYLQAFHPKIYSTIKHLRRESKNEMMEQKRQQYIKLNQTIKQQLIGYKIKYIQPLKNCPHFYQILHSKTIQEIGSNFVDKTYESVYRSINKQKVYNQFLLEYIQFKSKTKQSFLKQTKFVPICLFTSAEEMALILRQKQWHQLKEEQKIHYQTRFVKYIQKYNQQLKSHAQEANITLEMLLKLMSDQFNQPLDDQTKNILFPEL